MIETPIGLIDDSGASLQWLSLGDEDRAAIVDVMVVQHGSVPVIRDWLASITSSGVVYSRVAGIPLILDAATAVRDAILNRYALIREDIAQRYGLRWHALDDAPAPQGGD